MRAHVIVPDELIAEVDQLVGPRKRSEFFVEAVREHLRRERLKAAAEAAAGSLVGVDTPGWETSESAVEWVREQRRDWDRRVERLWLNDSGEPATAEESVEEAARA
jgi:metal-responsive CopG/Arc/MetJ family transcriptional regulator